jgi:sec-independent protein translocase protein TatC
VLIAFLAIAGIVNYRQLLNFSRWYIVIAVVVAAILTPPDVLTQIMMAVPLIILYYLSVLFAYFFGPKPDKP